MKFILFTLTFLGISIGLWSQNGVPPSANARGVSMGGASVVFQDINSAFSNQAGLAHIDGVGVALGGEQRFLVSDIASYSLAAAMPLGEKSGTVGLSINYYGFSEYNETRIGLAYARKLSDRVSLGAQFDYMAYAIPEYGTASVFTAEIGVQAILIENLIIGAHLFNPIRQEIIQDEDVPTVIRLGAGYSPNKKLLLSAELEKDINMPLRFKAGVEYYIVDQLVARAGVFTESNTSSMSLGLGLLMENGLRVDVASSYDYILGFTPAFTLSYQMKAKSNTSSKKKQ